MFQNEDKVSGNLFSRDFVFFCLPISATEVAVAVEQWKSALLMVSDLSDEVLI